MAHIQDDEINVTCILCQVAKKTNAQQLQWLLNMLVITTATAVVTNGFNSTCLYVIKPPKFLLKIYCTLHTLPVNRKTEKD
jgi:hypothetical protein